MIDNYLLGYLDFSGISQIIHKLDYRDLEVVTGCPGHLA